MTPHRAPRAIGAAERQDDRRDHREDVDQVADELEDEPEDRDVVERVHHLVHRRPPRRRTMRVIGLGSCRRRRVTPRSRKTRRTMTGLATRKNRMIAWRRSISSAGTPACDLHQAGAGAHRPEEQAGEEDADRVGARRAARP